MACSEPGLGVAAPPPSAASQLAAHTPAHEPEHQICHKEKQRNSSGSENLSSSMPGLLPICHNAAIIVTLTKKKRCKHAAGGYLLLLSQVLFLHLLLVHLLTLSLEECLFLSLAHGLLLQRSRHPHTLNASLDQHMAFFCTQSGHPHTLKTDLFLYNACC